MSKNHKHDHVCQCKHESLKYCSHCKVVHCEGCGREWKDNPGYWYYPNTTWSPQDITYTFCNRTDIQEFPNYGGATVSVTSEKCSHAS